MTALDLSPAPASAPRARRIVGHARTEASLLLRNGEQLLLALVIPIGLLVAGVLVGERVGLDPALLPASVLALALWSTSFTSLAIATGFERRSGVLKFLGATPLGRSGLLVGKVGATFAVIVVQLVLIAATALLLGWDPPAIGATGLAALFVLVVLGTLALGAWGLALAGVLRAEATLAVANAIFLLLLVAGGTVLPAERLPGALGSLVGLLPSAALGDGLRTVLDPATVGSPWPAVAILAAWAAGGIAVAVRTFRWE